MKTRSTQLLITNELKPRKATPTNVTLKKLLSFDEQIRRLYGSDILIGVDEVGRGCLAGPVYAAALIMPACPMEKSLAKHLMTLNDSKVLSFEERERLAPILENTTMWAIGSASPAEIDQINILQASLLAMRRAIEAMIAKYSIVNLTQLVVVDGRTKIPSLTLRQMPIVKGDGQSASIAAASVIAKVHRDRFMTKLAAELPNYHWQNNKGYSCRAHVEAIMNHGITVWHRQSFLRKYTAEPISVNTTMELNFSYEAENESQEEESAVPCQTRAL